MYRLVRTDPPNEMDFRSQRAEKLNQHFTVPECIARGISVFSDQNVARDLLRLRSQRGKLICKLTLENGAGFILKTGRPTHFTWWPFAEFDVVGNSQVLIP